MYGFILFLYLVPGISNFQHTCQNVACKDILLGMPTSGWMAGGLRGGLHPTHCPALGPDPTCPLAAAHHPAASPLWACAEVQECLQVPGPTAWHLPRVLCQLVPLPGPPFTIHPRSMHPLSRSCLQQSQDYAQALLALATKFRRGSCLHRQSSSLP